MWAPRLAENEGKNYMWLEGGRKWGSGGSDGLPDGEDAVSILPTRNSQRTSAALNHPCSQILCQVCFLKKSHQPKGSLWFGVVCSFAE